MLTPGPPQEHLRSFIVKKKKERKSFAYRDVHETNWKACPGQVVIEM